MVATHQKKSHDYATVDNPYSNFETAATLAGVDVDTVFRVLMGIKMARLRELLGPSTREPNFESVQDTRKDLAVYAALYASYFLKTADATPVTTGQWGIADTQKFFEELQEAERRREAAKLKDQGVRLNRPCHCRDNEVCSKCYLKTDIAYDQPRELR
jgi:hypothetical protein